MSLFHLPRRPVDEIINDSRELVSKLDEQLEELSKTIDYLVCETNAEKQREHKRRGRRR